MTKKLEELLDLPESKQFIQEEKEEKKEEEKKKKREIQEENKDTADRLREFDKIASALPSVKGLDKIADAELDDIATKALSSYEDLMDLGMNVEGRYSGRIFETAGNMLKTGLDARVEKVNKKLKMVELQLKKEKNDQDANKKKGDDDPLDSDGYIVTDRNSLLQQLKSQSNKGDGDK